MKKKIKIDNLTAIRSGKFIELKIECENIELFAYLTKSKAKKLADFLNEDEQ